MNILGIIKELEDNIIKCMKCGLCQSVCPVFLELGKESSVARGKIALVEALIQGRLKLTSTLAERIQCCLLCGTCVESCPSGVRVDYIVSKARAITARIRGISSIKWIILKIFLKNRRLFNLAVKIASTLQGRLFMPTGFGHTRKSRLDIGLNSKRVVLPLARETLKEKWQEIITPESPGRRVALFTGCTMNYMLTEIGDAVIKTLLKHGVEIIIPKGQTCCGNVAMAAGDESTFRALAKSNLELLSGLNVDAVIVACATCGYTLKHQYLALLSNEPEEFLNMAKMVSDRTYDICEYLINIIRVKRIWHKETQSPEDEIIVTYHDPCHLRRGLGIYKEQRELINLIDGVRLKEMSIPDRCCGGGGSFNLSYYDLSLKILDKKLDDIEKTGATVVLTSCAGCHMQLVDGLAQRLLPIQVKHPVELYYEALKDTYIEKDTMCLPFSKINLA
ncbi:MAG: (Fe-S)-binding protein [Desulfobacterales bacterium]|nr:(Fe-S)-binding protein [Desulfobacterales bacterium]